MTSQKNSLRCSINWRVPFMISQSLQVRIADANLLDRREYLGIDEVSGPIVAISGIHNVGYNDLVEIVGTDGSARLGMALEVSEGAAIAQVFEGTAGLRLATTKV